MKYTFPKDIILSVVAPVYNEEAGIAEFVAATVSTLQTMGVHYELVLVNDGSRDNTLSVLHHIATTQPNIRVLDFSRNFGREIAMSAGLEHAVGDYVVVMDSDMQDPPALIPALLHKLLDEQLDVVYAARTSRAGESFLKKLTSTLFYRVAAKTSGLNIPDNAGDFRIFSRKALNAVTALKEHNRYLKMLYAYAGFRTGSVPFDRAARLAGTSSYNYKKLVNAALDAIFAFSHAPLRWMSLFSIGLSLVLFGYAALVAIAKLMGGDAAEGWTSLMVMMSLLFAVMFVFLGLISEYIGRILTESKNRPLYFIRDEFGGSQFIQGQTSMVEKANTASSAPTSTSRKR